jgi:hypothetical protein
MGGRTADIRHVKWPPTELTMRFAKPEHGALVRKMDGRRPLTHPGVSDYCVGYFAMTGAALDRLERRCPIVTHKRHALRAPRDRQTGTDRIVGADQPLVVPNCEPCLSSELKAAGIKVANGESRHG